jgi:hypothetical protein
MQTPNDTSLSLLNRHAGCSKQKERILTRAWLLK